jgi:hypothetical protein
MTSRRITRTEYRVPGESGLPRLGPTTHAEDAVDIEGYVQPLEQVHSSAHGTGVLEGLVVRATVGGAVVRIEPGVAVDPDGRHICLAVGGLAETSRDPDAAGSLVLVEAGGVPLSTAGLDGGRYEINVRWRETFDQDLFAGSGQRIFQNNHTPWLRADPPGAGPDQPRVVLATVELAGDGTITAMSPAGRTGPELGLAGLRIQAPSATATTDEVAVTDVIAGRLDATAGGALRLVVTDPAAPIGLLGAAVGIGTVAPTHPLHVAASAGLRQNSLFLGGELGRSSLAYNAHRDAAGTGWTFPEPTRPAFAVEFSDSGGSTPRLEIRSTTTAEPTNWQIRASVDGNTGTVAVPGQLSCGAATVQNALRVQGSLDCDGRAVIRNRLEARQNGRQTTVNAFNDTGNAICAQARNATGVVALGKTAFVAFGPSEFNADVEVNGTLTADDKNFAVDHPLDPANKYLLHTAVESAERLTVYSGNAILDDAGRAEVPLPEWFDAVNTDVRYQLTCIGRPGRVHIAEEAGDGHFTIAGDPPGLKVSWQITGVRNDAWAQAHPFATERDKPDQERGHYRHPALYGQDLTAGVQWARHENLVRQHEGLVREMTRRAEADRNDPLIRFLG